MLSDKVSLCVLRVETQNIESNDDKTVPQKKNRSKELRKVKNIRVETFPSKLEVPREDWGLLPANSRSSIQLPQKENEMEIGFFSGNPFVELTKGVLHLYKEDVFSCKEQATQLCLLGVPAAVTCHDLLRFTAPCHEGLAHVRVLRDSSPSQYMALLQFRTHVAAAEFYDTYNGLPYNSLEPDRVCRAVWVSRVEWASEGAPPPQGHTELPTCPVCLERMDESVDGVLTILCNHSFHADCLAKWGDSTCPVCRCVQSPEVAEGSECMSCESSESLWICLVCGHVGCGRYQGGHAASHYRDTQHCYALQLGSGRVWDYKGDNFVHRLLQNKADGKLVPSGREDDSGGEAATQEKVDSVQLEYTYLLTSQLDAQRQYFEERLSRVEAAFQQDISKLRSSVDRLSISEKKLKDELAASQKEKQSMEKKIANLTSRLNAAHLELNEEKQMGEALRSNQSQWQSQMEDLRSRLTQSEAEATELREQLRDLSFHLEAASVISHSENRAEIQDGSITVGEGGSGARGGNRRSGGRRRR